jgi:membrane protease YdiL (CAAX protease family)
VWTRILLRVPARTLRANLAHSRRFARRGGLSVPYAPDAPGNEPMRAFLTFFGLIVAGLVAMALFAYPAWLLLSPHFDFPFHRIANRIGMLSLLIGFVLVARRAGVADRASLGYGLPRPRFLRELAEALALGVALMLPIIAVMAMLDLRAWKGGVAPDMGTIAGFALKGLLSGLTVAFIEETFLRGAMYTAIRRESGVKLAVVLTAIVYSALHFFARVKIPAAEVVWGSGMDLLAGTLRTFADPLAILDAFLCLFAVGVLLSVVRELTGSIAACVGLHAGWVWVITVVRETSAPDRTHPAAFLLSQFDGLVGWLVLAWTAVIGWTLFRLYARRA